MRPPHVQEVLRALTLSLGIRVTVCEITEERIVERVRRASEIAPHQHTRRRLSSVLVHTPNDLTKRLVNRLRHSDPSHSRQVVCTNVTTALHWEHRVAQDHLMPNLLHPELPHLFAQTVQSQGLTHVSLNRHTPWGTQVGPFIESWQGIC